MSEENDPPDSDDEQDSMKAHNVIEKVDQQQLQHFVTEIKTAEQQVGENIIRALQHDNTVAVLTTVVAGPSGQQVISAALDPRLMDEVRQLLQAAQEERELEEPCVGFHCLVKPKRSQPSPKDDPGAGDP